MAERTATIASTAGLHARPATLFVEAVGKQPVDVTIALGDGPALNAASILSIMSLGAGPGAVVTLRAEGDGADEALAGLVEFLETNHDA